MKIKLITTFISLILTIQVFANNSNNRYLAQKHIQKAILAYPTVRKYRKNLKKYILKKVNLNKKTVTVISSVAGMAYRGEVNTKVLKKLNIRVLGGNMRPDIIYNFKTNNIHSIANINWGF